MIQRLLIAAGMVFAAAPAIAALAPEHQNGRDLDALVAFIKSQPRVAGTLKRIDLESQAIHFDTHCKAEFRRQPVDRAPGWVGPQAPLVFHRSNCPTD